MTAEQLAMWEIGAPVSLDSDDWYTPPRIVNLARSVLGTIDLDPASTWLANNVVQAERYYDKESNGLSRPWLGRVFLNPPYSQPLCQLFIARLLAHVGTGAVTAAILITNSSSDADWWQDAAKQADAICFTDGRISFWRPDRDSNTNRYGQSIFYFGPDQPAFLRVFGAIGVCLRQIEAAP